MNPITITFPKTVSVERGLSINLETPEQNIVKIDNIDYYPYYLDNSNPGNRGGNSFVIKLVKAQEYEVDEGYPEIPDHVMKICKFKLGPFEDTRSKRFESEINALIDCNSFNLPNIIQVKHHGTARLLLRQSQAVFRFYTMDYADSDMISFLNQNELNLFEKIDLCLEICESLNQLWSRGYYHRDIKPDNILFMNNTWMISDLGLAKHRQSDADVDTRDNWIGPRGWMSPEAMNRFLTWETRFEKLFDCSIDHQSDIYQLGKVLWYILQGNSPEGGIRRGDFLLQSDEVYQVVRTMLNNSKRRRYLQINDVIAGLKRIHTRMIKLGSEVAIR